MRDSSSEDRFPSKQSRAELSSILEDSVGDDLTSKCNSQHTFANDLKGLRIKNKQGRPRKNTRVMEIKSFKVPKRKKKGTKEGLPVIHFTPVIQSYDEAKAILETGIQMGLIPVENEERSLSLIREQLT